MQQVTFSAQRQQGCNTMQCHKQQWREEGDACFLAGNTVLTLSLCQLKSTGSGYMCRLTG